MKASKILSVFVLLLLGFTLNAQTNSRSKVILYDDFYDNSREWVENNNENTTMAVRNGHYSFTHKREKGLWLTMQKISSINPHNDWTIETKMRHVRGVTNYAYGITFGRKDNDNQYFFNISANGYYRVVSDINGKRNKLKDWTKSSYVKQGSNVYNTLKVIREGSEWKFYINGSFVYSTYARTWPDKRVGFLVYRTQTIEVDYLSVKEKTEVKQVVSNYNNTNTYTNTTNTQQSIPPKIVIYEPQTSRGLTVVKAKTIRVAGKAKDTDGIFEVKVNGMDAKLMSDGYFTIEAPLAVGSNTITVKATDTKRMSTTETFSIKREQEYNNVVANNTNTTPVVRPLGPNTANQKRLALLIGNSSYMHGGSLPNPVNDVRSMKTALEQLGFTVLKFENCTQKSMRRAMDEFGTKLASFDIALFFYAGHGVQVDGSNYLVPTDAALKNKNDVEYDCVQAGRILGKMEASNAKTNIVILDACRDNPFERSWSRSTQGKGLAFMNAPSGSFVAYATSPGNTASDGVGSNGLYTSALLEHIHKPGLTIEQVFKLVRTTVKKKSKNKQIPWESTSLEGTFMFK